MVVIKNRRERFLTTHSVGLQGERHGWQRIKKGREFPACEELPACYCLAMPVIKAVAALAVATAAKFVTVNNWVSQTV